jgi:hypothetical protein
MINKKTRNQRKGISSEPGVKKPAIKKVVKTTSSTPGKRKLTASQLAGLKKGREKLAKMRAAGKKVGGRTPKKARK